MTNGTRYEDDGPHEWLDHSGDFRFGKHQGESVERVARDDPGYLRWVLDLVDDIAEDDRQTIQLHLSNATRVR